MLGQGFIEQFTIHPHRDDEDWLNIDFSDPDGDPDNTQSINSVNLHGKDEVDDRYLRGTPLNQVRCFDIDGTSYGHVHSKHAVAEPEIKENVFQVEDDLSSDSKIEESGIDGNDEDADEASIFATMNAYHIYTMRKRVIEANEKWFTADADDGIQRLSRSTKVRFNNFIELYSIEVYANQDGDDDVPDKLEAIKSIAELRPDIDDIQLLNFNCLFSGERLFPIDFTQRSKMSFSGCEQPQQMETVTLQTHGDFLSVQPSLESQLALDNHAELSGTNVKNATLSVSIPATDQRPMTSSSSTKYSVPSDPATWSHQTNQSPPQTKLQPNNLSTESTPYQNGTLPSRLNLHTNPTVPAQSGNNAPPPKFTGPSDGLTQVEKAPNTATIQKEEKHHRNDLNPEMKPRISLQTNPKANPLKHNQSAEKTIGALNTSWNPTQNLSNPKGSSSRTMVVSQPLKRIKMKISENRVGCKSQQNITSGSSTAPSARCSNLVNDGGKMKLITTPPSSPEKMRNRSKIKTTSTTKSNYVNPSGQNHQGHGNFPMSPILQSVLEPKNLSIFSKPCGQCPTGPMLRELRSQILKHNVQKSSLRNSLSKQMLSYIFDQNSNDSIRSPHTGHAVHFRRETVSSKSKSKAVHKNSFLETSGNSKWASKPEFTNNYKSKRKSNQNCGDTQSRGPCPKLTLMKMEKGERKDSQRKSKLERGFQSLSLRKECLPFVSFRSVLNNTGSSKGDPVFEKKRLAVFSNMTRDALKT
ncbi:unnamed protein product [Allacma fusca]|uniref:Uncharacterized protein n=1 Tax=Allacma fusca TaxID=39272 RepID=A0A8J2PSQ4_9HEXA|nr:unnamed protein product [Allacma fusca]